MKTTTINMSKAKGENVFANAVWKEASQEEVEKALSILSKYKQ